MAFTIREAHQYLKTQAGSRRDAQERRARPVVAAILRLAPARVRRRRVPGVARADAWPLVDFAAGTVDQER